MTAKSTQFNNEEVAQQGYLKRLKTGKKRYFVLKRPTKNSKGQLEYYGSRKKFLNNADPKKVIYMKDCFHVCKIEEKKYMNVFALFTREERFGLIAENQGALDGWLSAIGQVRKECLELEDSLKYDEVWSIKVKDEGLGRSKNIGGNYHLGLQDEKLALLTPDLHEVLHTIHLNNIKRSGQKDRFFFMEIGRKDTLGPGELWIEVDEPCIAEHMKRAIFGLGNRPRSQTDGSKEKLNQDPSVFNRSVSQCENNRNKIGSNYGTLKLPPGYYHNDSSGRVMDDRGGWIKQTLSSTSSAGTNRRPATVDFDTIAVDFKGMQMDYPKRLTVSTADLLDNSVATSGDSDDNAASDDDTTGDTNSDSICEDPYVAMHYSSPPDGPGFLSKVDHYDYVTPSRQAKTKEDQEPFDKDGTEDVYVAMTGDEESADGASRSNLSASLNPPLPIYNNVEEFKDKGNSIDSRGTAPDVKEQRTHRGMTYASPATNSTNTDTNKSTNTSTSHLPVVAETPTSSSTSSKFSEFCNRVGNLPKSLTLSPRLRRHTRANADSSRHTNSSSCFYVESPTDSVNDQQIVSKFKRRGIPGSSAKEDVDDSPSYVNIPRGDRSNMLVEEWKIKPETLKHADNKLLDHSGEKTVKEQVQIKDKQRGAAIYSNMDSPVSSDPPVVAAFSAREKRLVKQVSLPERKAVTPELPRKGSVPPVRDYVNIPTGNGTRQNNSLIYSRNGHERSKTRQGKTVQAENRKQVYTDFILPFSQGNKAPKKSSEMPILSSHNRTNGYQNVSEQSGLKQGLSYSSSLGKSVSYENLLDSQSDFHDKKKNAHELSYAELAFTHTSSDYAREFVSPFGHGDSSVRHRRFKLSKSCDDIFSSVDSDVNSISEEIYSMSPKGGKGITYMEVDIERSLGLAEAVREQRLQNE